ncbi:hypothetical protein [Mycolicibacterium frederiksbergense]|uniref:hypothetical protein n=1 Tax=Mycolicibacterium frederiksbergense TaxID=117567 RepID=UPI00265BA261|nr:hypothetical protein [Mycolicibacterium frederiksbergense]MDO0976952.1 hypothetical protein [Mycolicibacterium frederiksbergense]
MTRRNFTAVPHDDGLVVTAGRRSLRLSAAEVSDLADAIAAPIIEREVARLCGLES